MNIFVLDRIPEMAARYHCDKHITKMCIEACQMMSTAHWKSRQRIITPPYLSTHENHPVNRWVRTSVSNYQWTWRLSNALLAEYGNRYRRKSTKLGRSIRILKAVPLIPDIGLTDFVQSMPVELQSEDPVLSYREYYKTKSFVRWKTSEIPYWMKST